jgi:protein-S-isoprenylcysteine O-methyltransferase Ste14
MLHVGIGVFGFLVAFLFDLAALCKIPYGKRAVGLVAASLSTFAHVQVSTTGPSLRLPPFARYVGWILLLVSTPGLVFSLFLEIPFRRTYVDEGTSGELVTTGTYALARHPGVLWYTLLLAGMVLASRRRRALMAGPIWLGLDILYVWIQERFFFDEMFPGYDRYRQQTPMLIPNRRSIIRCWKTLR